MELGYSLPEKALRTEKLRRTLGVLLVIDSSVGYLFHFIRTIIENLERRVREDGYDVVLIPISFQSTDSEIVEKVVDARVKAVASLHYANINAFIRLEDRGIPIVVVMNNTHVHTYYTVGSDDFRGPMMEPNTSSTSDTARWPTWAVIGSVSRRSGASD